MLQLSAHRRRRSIRERESDPDPPSDSRTSSSVAGVWKASVASVGIGAIGASISMRGGSAKVRMVTSECPRASFATRPKTACSTRRQRSGSAVATVPVDARSVWTVSGLSAMSKVSSARTMSTSSPSSVG